MVSKNCRGTGIWGGKGLKEKGPLVKGWALQMPTKNKKQPQTTLPPHIWKKRATEMEYSGPWGPHYLNKVACGIVFKLWVWRKSGRMEKVWTGHCIKKLATGEQEALLNNSWGASLVAQWLRIRLPMQRTWVRALVREDPTCCRATKPVRHNYWACALEPESHNCWAHGLHYWSLHA